MCSGHEQMLRHFQVVGELRVRNADDANEDDEDLLHTTKVTDEIETIVNVTGVYDSSCGGAND